MLDELKEEEIVNKVGGRFKLSTIIQKRLVQLNAGSRALVDLDPKDKMSVVLQEIIQDKIYLNPAGDVVTREAPPEVNVLDFEPSDE
ncbi:MAG: DNA-directed RNA polymerase subunit omega [Pirellulaceae bacterium]|jgi:DNA-directed RNA polymerase subunit omega|nr:DNA-directed RNA polymerase subunit omega [Planctomycetaceae bacterium]HIM31395.1 DNA-directed RNA polymerase subunit omega [Planctomycetota bacterium]